MSANPKFNGRAERIRTHLASHRKGVTLRALIVAIEPGCKANNMRSSIETLIRQKKVITAQVDGITKFLPTGTIFADGRIEANAKKAGKPRPLRKQPLVEPANGHSRTAKPGKPAPRSNAPAAAPHRRALDSSLITRVDARQAHREQLAADVAAFEAGGGVVQRLAWGESAASIAEQQQRFHEQRQRGSGQKIAARTQRTATA